MEDFEFDSISSAVEDYKQGKMLVVVDDEDRENEGDFVLAAEKATPEAINIMAKYGRGLICVPLTRERAYQLDLDYMVPEGADPDEAAFTVSVDHKAQTTTGISAYDRARTIRELINSDAAAKDFRKPGHIFPLIGIEGGVLRRAGHTEAAVDLARMAGLKPAGVVCEILNESGDRADRETLFDFAEQNGLEIISIEELIRYRRVREKLVYRVTECDLPTKYGAFRAIAYGVKYVLPVTSWNPCAVIVAINYTWRWK